MGHGGRRPGAGRKPGFSSTAQAKNVAREAVKEATRDTAQAIAAAVAEELLPLQVMLSVMRTFHQQGELTRAASVAKDAAPYLHPRLSAVMLGGTGENGEIVVKVIGQAARLEEL